MPTQNTLSVVRIQDYEVNEAAGVWHRAGKLEYKYLPAFQALTLERAQAIFRRDIYELCDIWVAKAEARIVGLAALQGDTLDRLYVDPNHQRIGVGSALMRQCLALRPKGIRLFTHQENLRAQGFYEAFGFVAVRFGVSPSPESMPDIEYRIGDPSVE
jgi:ribosomal protein S18 acetylase RimI-like enzyme